MKARATAARAFQTNLLHIYSMQERTHKQQVSRNFLDVAIRTKSWQPVVRDGWIIKFSIYREKYILLMFCSIATGQLIVRQFDNEDHACNFISHIIELEPSQTHNL